MATATETLPRTRRSELLVPAALLVLAGVAWAWSAVLADMPSSLATFELAWVAMMAAMMFPAIIPVVSLYRRGAAAGRVAPLPFFVGGYLLVWSALGLPVYAVWQTLMMPLEDGMPWAGRLAGASFLAAGIWQLTPLKDLCLRHCRSPMSLFMRAGQSLTRPVGALRTGGHHGLYCVGCCWGLMAVLVAVGTMNVVAMVAVAGLIFLEKNSPGGAVIARLASVPLAVTGCWLLLAPTAVAHLV